VSGRARAQMFEVVMHLFFSKPTREMVALADETLSRLASSPLKIGVQMRIGGGDWNDPMRYRGERAAARAQQI
jgi:hypothetical protein